MSCPVNARRPSSDQLALLRRLAERTSQTFAYPATAAEAREEILRLCAVVLARPALSAVDPVQPLRPSGFRTRMERRAASA